MFSMVISLGGIDGTDVVDLFAGSGALGIEALSRGAASVLFVERDRSALTTIRANLENLGLAGPKARLVNADAVTCGATLGDVDVVFADPPYAFTAWPELLHNLACGGLCGLAVLESGTEIAVDGAWDVVRVKRYGGTVVTIIRPRVLAPSSTGKVRPG